MDLTGTLLNVTFGLDGTPMVTFKVNEKDIVREFADSFRDKVLSLKVSIFRKKRSLDANAYCWTLIGSLAKVLRIPKNEVYMEYIREIGDYDVVCIKDNAAPKLRQAWESKGLGWQTDETLSKLDGCTNVFLYYGSSSYTTEQMSRFISMIKDDCIAHGIPTRPQEEIDALLNSWEGKF
jgi:hypothetical protein